MVFSSGKRVNLGTFLQSSKYVYTMHVVFFCEPCSAESGDLLILSLVCGKAFYPNGLDSSISLVLGSYLVSYEKEPQICAVKDHSDRYDIKGVTSYTLRLMLTNISTIWKGVISYTLRLLDCIKISIGQNHFAGLVPPVHVARVACTWGNL